MNKRLAITVIATVLILSGCSAVKDNRIRQEVLADSKLPEEIRRAIDLKELAVGMTQEQVIASWGSPCKWCYRTRKSSSGDTWEYHIPGADSVIVDLISLALEPELTCTSIKTEYSNTGPISKYPKPLIHNHLTAPIERHWRQ